MKKHYDKPRPIREREVKSYSVPDPTRTYNIAERLNHRELAGGFGFLDPRILDEAREEYEDRKRQQIRNQ
jgi:hypothetical protein